VRQKALLVVLALLFGVGIGALTRTESGVGSHDSPASADGAPATAGSDYARIIDGLSATVELEVTERQRLESQVESMSSQISRLERDLSDLRGSEPTAARAQTQAQPQSDSPSDDSPSALDPFLEAGFDPDRAEYVKQLQDDLALQRLYLRDQAEREGWLRSPRYRDAMQAIAQREEGLEQELGQDDYDRYLYAVGRPNRVLVGDVLANGPAQRAGIQIGDSILSYGGERIFEANALVNATREGTAGMSTAVEIEREGDTQLVYVPRGPLGINLRVARVRPGD
jgi:C-terminal processing protease CtpA/Prc